jgi:tripartite-type tricarboxylate transporter receptor subunit TctC
MQDLVGGRIDYMCDTIQTGAVQANSGTVKGIAVMSPKRVPVVSGLPTTGEQGLAGAEATVWNAYFFPKGTPQPIVRKMNKALGDMLARPDFREKSEALGLALVPPEQRSPEYLAKYLGEEIERWGKVIRAGGISVD